MINNNNSFDLFNIYSDFSNEYQEIIKRVRTFVNNEVLPSMHECHNQATFPQKLIDGVKNLGILEDHAKNSLCPIAYGLICRELERGSSGLRSFVSVQASLVMSSILFFGTQEQIDKWIIPMGKLDKIGCFALTEPDYGSNPSELKSIATKTKNGYSISGTKSWITNGNLSDVAIIWAQLEGKVRGFLVETNLPGFVRKEITGKWSFRSSSTADLILNNVEVGRDSLMEKTRSVGSALKCLSNARYGIAWGVIGAAQSALEETINYLNARVQFNNRPLTTHQLIQNKLAWMATEITAMELIAKQLGELKIKGQLQPHHISLAKMNNCRKALEITRDCRELLGANGIHSEYHVGRRMVDLETVITYEGTENIHSLVIGNYLTGEKAYV